MSANRAHRSRDRHLWQAAPELATYFNYSPFISAASDPFGDRISEPLAKTTGGPRSSFSSGNITDLVQRKKISGYEV